MYPTQTRVFLAGGAMLLAFVVAGCAASRPSALTPGAAKIHIEKNVTTQADVVEVFGTPNVVTRRDGQEIWVYDKVSSETATGAFGIGGFGVGVGSGGGGAGGISAASGKVTRSETTMMMIVYFDENDVVTDYKLSQTKF